MGLALVFALALACSRASGNSSWSNFQKLVAGQLQPQVLIGALAFPLAAAELSRQFQYSRFKSSIP